MKKERDRMIKEGRDPDEEEKQRLADEEYLGVNNEPAEVSG